MRAIVIFIVAIPSLSVQQYYPPQIVGHYHPYNYDKQYVSSKYHRSSRRHRHPRQYSNNGHLVASYETSDTDGDSYQDSCECECQRCADPKPCCARVCIAECQEQMPANLVFVPYPYPLVMPDVHPSPATDATTTTTQTTTTTTEKTTTTTTTTTTETPNETPGDNELMKLKASCEKFTSNRLGNSFYDDLRSNMRSRQMYQKDFREQLGIRPVKPNTLPKYGIVPIPDKILQSLFSQILNALIMCLLLQDSLHYRMSYNEYSEYSSSEKMRRRIKRYKHKYRIGIETYTRLYPYVSESDSESVSDSNSDSDSDSESNSSRKKRKYKCSCRKCKRPKPRCHSVCNRCLAPQQSLMVPYPVPYIMPVMVQATTVPTTTVAPTTETTTFTTGSTTTTTTTTTTATTTTTTATQTTLRSHHHESTPRTISTNMVTVFKRNNIRKSRLDAYRLCRNNECDTFTDDDDPYEHLKRSLLNGLPKFGIIPIPDDLAERLMRESQPGNIPEMPSGTRYNDITGNNPYH